MFDIHVYHQIFTFLRDENIVPIYGGGVLNRGFESNLNSYLKKCDFGGGGHCIFSHFLNFLSQDISFFKDATLVK